LSAGFTPDPSPYSAPAGGPIDVSYLGPCAGYAAQPPDIRVNWASGSGRLRFYFIPDFPGSDAALVINDPTGQWFCNDDSYGGVNPTVDFASSVGGTYDIWLASIDPTQTISGTLYVTELDGNHP
jgi:hypothetical protein